MKNFVVAIVCAGALSAGVVSAAPLQGTFAINGGAGNPVRVGADWIDFAPFNYPAPGSGSFVTTGGTIDFGFPPTTGAIADLIALGVGSITPVQNWLEFSNHPEWNFVLTTIFPGVGIPEGCDATVTRPEVPCTPSPASPFTLTNIREAAGGFPPATSVSMTVAGAVFNGLGERSIFTLTFTSQLDNLSALGALQQIAGDDELNYVQSSWSAEGTVIPAPEGGEQENPIPEPGSLVLLGLALSATGVAVRRRPGVAAR